MPQEIEKDLLEADERQSKDRGSLNSPCSSYSWAFGILRPLCTVCLFF